jgi:hypothetical protein
MMDIKSVAAGGLVRVAVIGAMIAAGPTADN